MRADLERIKPLPKPVKALTNIKEIQEDAEINHLFRPYIVNLSLMLAPLNDKTKKNGFIKWNENDTITLKKIKNLIHENIIVYHPNNCEDFEL